MQQAREGDFIELDEYSIFEVKGLSHPSYGVIAYPRYLPSERGVRIRCGRRYLRLYTFEEREKVLKGRFAQYYTFNPYYNRLLPIIPWSRVQRHFKPQDMVRVLRASHNLAGLRLKVLEFIEYISREADVPTDNLGISGSILLGLEEENSDIDLIVYGLKESAKVREAILNAMAEGSVLRTLTEERLKELYLFRSRDTAMRYEDFKRVEQRKSNQGLFKDTLFFVRYLREWSEVEARYGEYSIRRLGYGKIYAKVADANEAHMCPAIYILKDVTLLSGPSWTTIDRLITWRGRFAEQASEGEAIVAQGFMEEVLFRDRVVKQMVVGEERYDTILPLSGENYKA
ncbi:MAG: hypothetical protein QXJ86_05720 [Nitrososphaerales archaeon]